MRRSWTRFFLDILALSFVTVSLVLGYDGLRVLQVMILALPALIWLCWPHQHPVARGGQAIVAALVGLIFIVDGIIRGFILEGYGTSPDSSIVLNAVANTSREESAEFFAMYWPSILVWKLLALVSLVSLLVSLWLWWKSPPEPLDIKGWRIIASVLICALISVAFVLKPWRNHHPMLFWPAWVQTVALLQTQWINLGNQRKLQKILASKQEVTLTHASPDTMVLVIGESINRDHLSLYGYPRDTTPQLLSRHQAHPDRFQIFRHAWSVDAGTVAALRNFFLLSGSDENKLHLLALASAAGFKTWWITNQDDLSIDQEHARLADNVHQLNQIPGRSSKSLDEVTLPVLEEALRDPFPRKLIVVHLMGAHPHYKLRTPPEWPGFTDSRDAVFQALKEQGRSYRARTLRNDYDSAIQYHDSILASTLDATQRFGNNAIWLYFSDHGQEVASLSNRAGHSPSTVDGYRIPLIIWGNGLPEKSIETGHLPVRSDWLGYSVLRLLGVDWEGYQADKDVLNPLYRWQAPSLPVTFCFTVCSDGEANQVRRNDGELLLKSVVLESGVTQ